MTTFARGIEARNNARGGVETISLRKKKDAASHSNTIMSSISYLGQENVRHGLCRVVLGVPLAGALPFRSHLGDVHRGAVATRIGQNT